MDDPSNPDGDDGGDDGGGGGGGGGDDDPTDPDDTPTDEAARDYDGIATAIGASAYVGDLSAMLDMVVISEGGMPAGVTYLGVSGEHHHASASRGGLTFDYLYHCNDNADVIVPVCDGNANHSHVQVTWSGSLAAAAMAIDSVALEGDWAIRDLQVDRPRVGGDGTMSFVARIGDREPATFNVSYEATFDRVRFEAGQSLPAAGKIDLAIAAERTRAERTRTFAVAGALAFDGTTIAVLTLDATNVYSVDLTTGTATRR